MRTSTVSSSRVLLAGLRLSQSLLMATWRHGRPDALLHHSDRGSQYTSEQFRTLMEGNGVTCSMSRSGNVWDNVVMESFFFTLKTERTARKHTSYATRLVPMSSTSLSASTIPSVGIRQLDT